MRRHDSKFYLVSFEDGWRSGAARVLQELGAPVITHFTITNLKLTIHNPKLASLQAVVIILAEPGTVREERKFPSRYLRLMPSIARAQECGFDVPKPMLEFLDGKDAAVMAIRKDLCDDPIHQATHRYPLLAEAIAHAHKRDVVSGAWLMPKEFTSKSDWRDRMAKRRKERNEDHNGDRRHQYALP